MCVQTVGTDTEHSYKSIETRQLHGGKAGGDGRSQVHEVRREISVSLNLQ